MSENKKSSEEAMESLNANVLLGQRVREIVLNADESSHASIWQQCSALFSAESAKVIKKKSIATAAASKRKRAASTKVVTAAASAKAAPKQKRQRKKKLTEEEEEDREAKKLEKEMESHRMEMATLRQRV